MGDEKDDKCCGCTGCDHKEAEEKQCECGMPLDEKTECKCEHGVCIHCCNCPDGGEECGCFCEKKAAADNDDETEDNE